MLEQLLDVDQQLFLFEATNEIASQATCGGAPDAVDVVLGDRRRYGAATWEGVISRPRAGIGGDEDVPSPKRTARLRWIWLLSPWIVWHGRRHAQLSAGRPAECFIRVRPALLDTTRLDQLARRSRCVAGREMTAVDRVDRRLLGRDLDEDGLLERPPLAHLGRNVAENAGVCGSWAAGR